MTTEKEFPKYVSHKEVRALKIGPIGVDVAGYHFDPVDEGYPRVYLKKGFMEKHNPVEGGYFVVYSDGYESYSPASAFEQGYRLLTT